MANNWDILLDENNEILITNGDLVISDASQQHVELLLLSNKGDFKQFPLTGIGLMRYLNAPLNNELKTQLYRDIKLQLDDNGLNISGIEGKINEIKIQ